MSFRAMSSLWEDIFLWDVAQRHLFPRSQLGGISNRRPQTSRQPDLEAEKYAAVSLIAHSTVIPT
jgi:hypothetical protein